MAFRSLVKQLVQRVMQGTTQIRHNVSDRVITIGKHHIAGVWWLWLNPKQPPLYVKYVRLIYHKDIFIIHSIIREAVP